MRRNKGIAFVDKLGESIGVGLLAGAAGTAAITMSQMAEMHYTGRKPSNGPATAVQKTLDINPKPGTKKKMAGRVHWVYGTIWGVARGILAVAGIKKWPATAAHFVAIAGTGLAMAPLEGAKPANEWTKKDLAIDLMHHAVYAVAAGLVFDVIFNSEKR